MTQQQHQNNEATARRHAHDDLKQAARLIHQASQLLNNAIAQAQTPPLDKAVMLSSAGVRKVIAEWLTAHDIDPATVLQSEKLALIGSIPCVVTASIGVDHNSDTVIDDLTSAIAAHANKHSEPRLCVWDLLDCHADISPELKERQ